MTQNTDPYSRYAAEYTAQYETRAFETVLVAVRRRRVLQSLAAHPHHDILEVGCGLEPLFPHVDSFTTYTIVEPVPAFARAARNAAAGHEGVTVIEGTVEAVAATLPGAHPDFVVMSGLLHEVPNPRRVLRAVRGAIGTETVVHINVPNVRSFHRLLALEMGLIKTVFEASAMDRRLQHHAHFDRAELVELVEAEGFRVLDSGSYLIKPFTNDQMDALLGLDLIDRASLIAGLDKMVTHMPELGCEIYVDVVPA